MIKKMTISAAVLAAAVMLGACNDDIEMRRPPKFELPELPTVEDIHTYKAPLYWSVYEYCYELERQGIAEADMDISSEE